MLVENVDLVVDGLDRLTPRLVLNKACLEKGIPYIYGAVITHIGNVSTIVPGKTACLECWQGGVDEANVPTCAIVGVMPPAISIVASLQVSEAVRIILGEEPRLAGRLLYFDLNDLSMETINLVKAESCKTCGTRVGDLHEDGLVEEVCGRNGRRVFTFTPKTLLDLDLPSLESKLELLHLKKNLSTRLGLTFSGYGGFTGSIFKTGVAVFEGAESEVDALKIYESITGVEI